jgi:hypothetical protein
MFAPNSPRTNWYWGDGLYWQNSSNVVEIHNITWLAQG